MGPDIVCFVFCLSVNSASPRLWQGGRGKEPQNPPYPRRGFCSPSFFAGGISRIQVAFHCLIARAWICIGRRLWEQMSLLEAGGPSCSPNFVTFGFKLCFSRDLIKHMWFNSCNVLPYS